MSSRWAFTRRSFLASLAARTGAAQKFTDITAPAGLSNARNISGSADNKRFLLEEMGKWKNQCC